MKAKILVYALPALILTTIQLAEAQQQPTKIPRIGYLMTRSLDPVRTEALRQGLREFGYVEVKTIVIEWRSAEGKLDRLPPIVTELVASQSGCHRHRRSGTDSRYQGRNFHDSHCHDAG